MLSQKSRCLLASQEELWELEDKYDVDIDALYGPGRIVLEHELNAWCYSIGIAMPTSPFPASRSNSKIWATPWKR